MPKAIPNWLQLLKLCMPSIHMLLCIESSPTTNLQTAPSRVTTWQPAKFALHSTAIALCRVMSCMSWYSTTITKVAVHPSQQLSDVRAVAPHSPNMQHILPLPHFVPNPCTHFSSLSNQMVRQQHLDITSACIQNSKASKVLLKSCCKPLARPPNSTSRFFVEPKTTALENYQSDCMT